MKAVYKDVGKAPEIIDVGNSLRSFQHLVHGYIEAIPICTDVVLLCNEEGRINGMPFNLNFLNAEFFGPILIVGAHGDEFCDCPGPELWLNQMVEENTWMTF